MRMSSSSESKSLAPATLGYYSGDPSFVPFMATTLVRPMPGFHLILLRQSLSGSSWTGDAFIGSMKEGLFSAFGFTVDICQPGLHLEPIRCF
jgi:hypothetical protein